MLIFQRYILRELVGPVLLSILFFTMLMLLRQFFEMAELLLEAQVSWTTLAEIMGILTISLMVITIPMAALLGVLIGTSRMTTENEILAMRVSGASLFRVFYPAIILAFVGGGALMWLGFDAIPAVFGRLVDQRSRIEFELMTRLEPGRNHDSFSPEGSNFYLYFDKRGETQPGDSPYTLRMEGVALRVEGEASGVTGADVRRGNVGMVPRPEYIVEGEQKLFRYGDQETMFFAQRGTIIGDPEAREFNLTLENGTIIPLPRMVFEATMAWERTKALYRDNPQRESQIRFDSMSKTITPQRRGRSSRPEPQLYTLAELHAAVANPPTGPLWRNEARRQVWDEWRDYLMLRNELYQRYSLPFALPAFILIAIPLALELRPRAKSASFLIAVLVITLYYVIVTWAGALGARNSPLTPYAYILPNVLFGGMGLLLFWRVERQ